MIYRIICNENTFNVCLCCIWHCAIWMRPLRCMEIKNKKELKALEPRTIIIFQQNWFIIASGQASPDILGKRKFTWDTFHFLFLYHCPFYYPSHIVIRREKIFWQGIHWNFLKIIIWITKHLFHFLTCWALSRPICL